MREALLSFVLLILFSCGFASAQTLYYGYGCNGASTNTCTVNAGSGTGQGNYSSGLRITTGSNATGYTVNACGMYFLGTANGNMTCAVYDANATGSNPITGCEASSAVALSATNAWTEDTNFSGCTLAASTTYNIQFQLSSSTATYAYVSSGTRYYIGVTFGVFPTSVTWSSSTLSESQYFRVTQNSTAVCKSCDLSKLEYP